MSLLLPKLSIELLHEIVLFLPPRDIRACRQTCKGFSRLIGDSLLLQYILLRDNSCVVDNPSTDMSVKCRLEALQRWERAWEVMRIRTLVCDMQVPGGKDDLTYTIRSNFLIGVSRYGNPPGYYYLAINDPIQDDCNWTWVDCQPYGTQRRLFSVFATEQNLTVITSVSE
jgi:F-box domain